MESLVNKEKVNEELGITIDNLIKLAKAEGDIKWENNKLYIIIKKKIIFY